MIDKHIPLGQYGILYFLEKLNENTTIIDDKPVVSPEMDDMIAEAKRMEISDPVWDNDKWIIEEI